jgi:hypothetical protein
VNGDLNANKDSHSQGDPYHGEEGSSLMIAQMTESNVSEEMKEDHKIIMSNVKAQMANE